MSLSVSKNIFQSDRVKIDALFEQLHRAYATHNADGIVSAYTRDAVIYDLAPPLFHRGLDTKTLEQWLATWDGPLGMDMQDFDITIDENLAVATALSKMHGTQRGEHQEIWLRTTWALRKIHGQWLISHDHASVPFYMDGSYRAATDLTP
ncbi:YybH family protein [Cellvibrio mixtus]|uniref:YybH family protein n=1 Tax=Cellvibrio mixtus TaxID=39650 RepID=UPI00058653FD|nr:nuclear transport factor 2 family protein [Cellvibrio mixtus]